jgi:hypothetical protein
MSKLDLNKALPAETAAEYKISGLEKNQSTKILFPKYGVVDFSKLTLKKAEHLLKVGAPFISKKKKDAAADKGSN